MMFMKNGPCLFALALLMIECTLSVAMKNAEKDPFKSLGIPDLNAKAILEEINKQNLGKEEHKTLPQLKNIDDLPSFLKNSRMNEEDGIKVLTRFLIQDDYTLKKYGVVYDQTGFDGITHGERIAPVGTEERLSQRARSASNIWFKQKFPKLDYDAYGADNLMDEIVPNWRVFKVLMIGKNGENTFIKVCLPLDESETALCSDKDELCAPRAEYVEKEKKKNEDYIEKIRSNNFFSHNNVNKKIKLLPGEKLIVKEGDKKLVFGSQDIKSNNNFGLHNPPSINSMNNDDPLLNAYIKKNNLRGQGYFNSGFNQFNNSPLNYANFQSGHSEIGNQMNSMNNPYNFKQKEQNFGIQYNNPQTSINSNFPPQSNELNNTGSNDQILNEMKNMKNQLNEMMQALKQKDQIINQQNMQLAQFNNGFGSINMYQNQNQYGYNNIQQQMQNPLVHNNSDK